jgi:hypothetical protein
VRAGEQVAKDMIALRIGPDISTAVVGNRPISTDMKPDLYSVFRVF